LPSFAALVVEDPDAPRAASRSKLKGPRGIEVIVDDVRIRAEIDADVDHLSRVIRAARAATG
jgi:hypothetical protein